jgi:photosystem II stability/assembly factor-like uncharacterized protein
MKYLSTKINQKIYIFLFSLFLVITILNWNCTEKNKNPITPDDSKISWAELYFPDVGHLSYQFCDEIVTNSSGDLFVSIWSGGIFRSQDGGQTWQQVNQNLTNLFIDALAVNFNNHLFAGAQNVGDIPAGIFKSDDDGNSWNYCGLEEEGFSSLCINSNDSVFAGSSWGAIFRSADDGAHWTEVHPNISYIVLTLTETPQGEILAGSGTGLYRSLDQGDSWELFGFPDSSITSVAVSRTNTILVSTDRGGHVFRSSDQGVSWELVSSGLPPNPRWYWLLILNSEDRLFAAVPNLGIYQSLDLGNSWQSCNDGLTDTEVSAMGFDPEGYLYAGTVNGNIFRTSESTVTVPHN